MFVLAEYLEYYLLSRIFFQGAYRFRPFRARAFASQILISQILPPQHKIQTMLQNKVKILVLFMIKVPNNWPNGY